VELRRETRDRGPRGGVVVPGGPRHHWREKGEDRNRERVGRPRGESLRLPHGGIRGYAEGNRCFSEKKRGKRVFFEKREYGQKGHPLKSQLTEEAGEARLSGWFGERGKEG